MNVLLDTGICTIFRKVDVSEPGGMPTFAYKLKTKAWYGQLDFATEQEWPTEGREESEIAARIRILQDRQLSNHDAVVLADVDEIDDYVQVLEVTRAYHGHDDDSGELITDLTLKAVNA